MRIRKIRWSEGFIKGGERGGKSDVGSGETKKKGCAARTTERSKNGVLGWGWRKKRNKPDSAKKQGETRKSQNPNNNNKKR